LFGWQREAKIKEKKRKLVKIFDLVGLKRRMKSEKKICS